MGECLSRNVRGNFPGRDVGKGFWEVFVGRGFFTGKCSRNVAEIVWAGCPYARTGLQVSPLRFGTKVNVQTHTQTEGQTDRRTDSF